MQVTEIGRSLDDNPVWKCAIGTGPVVMITSGQHGNEPATRESSHALLRDLAYRTKPWMVDFLASHRVVVIPTGSPDARVANTRLTHDKNLNRGWRNLFTVENKAIQSVITAENPEVLLDAHEVPGSGQYDYRPYGGGFPGEWPVITTLANDFVDESIQVLAGMGYTSSRYNVQLLPWQSMQVVASGDHRIGVLAETTTFNGTRRQERVEISYVTYRVLLEWYRDHELEIRQAIADSKQAAATGDGATYIPTRQYTDPRKGFTETHAVAYLPAAPLPQEYISAFGIAVNQDGTVPVKQVARQAVVGLLDPDSIDNVVDATPIYLEPPLPPESKPSGQLVEVGGLRYRVKQTIAQQGGVRYPVAATVTQADGARFVR